MRRFPVSMSVGLCILMASTIYGQIRTVDHFNKVIISPYIGATFVQGEQESVTVNNSVVDDKHLLHVEAKGGTLRIYLDGAKDIPRPNSGSGNHEPYPNHAVEITVTYKKLDALSLRGQENFFCKSPLSAETFTLKIYGESSVSFSEVHIDNLYTTIYGESSVEILSGSVNKQSFTCYGEGKVNTTAISGARAKLTAYGEADFSMNVSERIKITAFGEAKLHYKGNPDIVKGLHFGGVEMERLN